MSEVLFECLIEVPRHSSKKNEKSPRVGRSGKMFIGQTSKAKFCETWMVRKLLVERLKARTELIECDINAEYIFYFPRTIYFTKSGERSKKLPDLSNLVELPNDLLQETKAKIIRNDTQIVSLDGCRRMPIEGTKYMLKITLSRAE